MAGYRMAYVSPNCVSLHYNCHSRCQSAPCTNSITSHTHGAIVLRRWKGFHEGILVIPWFSIWKEKRFGFVALIDERFDQFPVGGSSYSKFVFNCFIFRCLNESTVNSSWWNINVLNILSSWWSLNKRQYLAVSRQWQSFPSISHRKLDSFKWTLSSINRIWTCLELVDFLPLHQRVLVYFKTSKTTISMKSFNKHHVESMSSLTFQNLRMLNAESQCKIKNLPAAFCALQITKKLRVR